jgi:hypothetical protein
MTRRAIILQILAEAAGHTDIQVAEGLLAAMIAEDLISNRDLEEAFTSAEGLRMLAEFRTELPGIRRWLFEAGLLEVSGNA